MAADRSRMSRQELASVAGISRASLYRVLGGDPKVAPRTLRRVEAALSLPYDTLTFVAAHDWQTLAEIGAPSELVAWMRRWAGDSNDERA